ncbi:MULTISPECIES: undecaprenyldiphospho-muramoylpentapeptide beta-N-acetylglucosaminyltransferase [unclassified Synechocystis]|uniref:undecaprenyldiphospho-muramoylpentapeptide beta-N-acetylglucosaminyltransferase n=1 Tax=unclassified Synechocystis TaxID=2640012 RepID=UPI000406485A|nr:MULTISPECIES: undecaprenyldiphospho-muramoylpentapeptide beta-N-acetylglucosaminyltransferase [unclassified Synechocystis]AIE74524.1 UDP-N-acetylglucosamine--N-acetylmuramyl- (pentapeptide) pyrophosphoryl-undecaprenol N-acetylglucosamine transferase [Synechocystis sp. PCC 6714]MCT0254719.1 undecaprenyldiphospho-muramoylpentapeptide beta-N-acetylglucosaminyltransferase [Synechocystis sp. CS-94]
MTAPIRLLIAASGTGGHLFPALALAQQLPDYDITWLGVPDRLETTLVPRQYPLQTIPVEGFQGRPNLKTIKIGWNLLRSIFTVRKLIKSKQIDAVATTGGYIAAPAIVAAKLCGIPIVFHESNFIPGKVTTWLGRWCDRVAIGFQGTATYLPSCRTTWISTPVRQQFRQPQPLDLHIPTDRLLIVVAGGSQGAVTLNRQVRSCVSAWVNAGAFIVHLTGKNDPEAANFSHDNYLALEFFDNMAGLLQRTDLAISRAGAGTLTELAVTRTPSILIPYPFAAENHQMYNAQVFADAGAALVFTQKSLTTEQLEQAGLELLQCPEKLAAMASAASELATIDSAEQLAAIVRASLKTRLVES